VLRSAHGSDSLRGCILAAPQGFEPRYADPESAVLPLNEGAVASLSNERETGSMMHHAILPLTRLLRLDSNGFGEQGDLWRQHLRWDWTNMPRSHGGL
jgi:hypothetical protein